MGGRWWLLGTNGDVLWAELAEGKAVCFVLRLDRC